jgi:hypothetical protein
MGLSVNILMILFFTSLFPCLYRLFGFSSKAKARRPVAELIGMTTPLPVRAQLAKRKMRGGEAPQKTIIRRASYSAGIGVTDEGL